MGPLDYDQKICARCGRPCSPKDFEPAQAANRAAARRRLARKAFNWILFAACAAGAYSRRETILALASLTRAAVAREMDDASRPARPGKQLTPEAQRLLGAITGGRHPASASAEADASSVSVVAEKAAAPRPAARPPKPPVPTGPGAKRVYGVVYDMGTAAAVAGATLIFSKDGRVWHAGTDSDGHYTVDIPAEYFKEGLTAVVRAGGYREGQIEDVDPPYRERTAEERHSAIEQLSPSDLDPLPVRAPKSATVLSFDVVLVPSKN
jgi:hypothetical protein